MIWIRAYQHLLPKARSWRLTINKRLRQFFDGLTGLPKDYVDYVDDIYLDLFPQTTRELDRWLRQFAITTGGTEQEQRDKLATAWAAVGGQSLTYIQSTLQSAGFDVYLHEWYDPTSVPPVGVKQCLTPRDPNAADYLLANKILGSVPDYTCLAGDPTMESGEPRAQSGEFNGLKPVPVEYEVPTDTTKWPYVMYVGGATYGSSANVPTARRDEFENLLLQLRPTHNWVGFFINYV